MFPIFVVIRLFSTTFSIRITLIELLSQVEPLFFTVILSTTKCVTNLHDLKLVNTNTIRVI